MDGLKQIGIPTILKGTMDIEAILKEQVDLNVNCAVLLRVRSPLKRFFTAFENRSFKGRGLWNRFQGHELFF